MFSFKAESDECPGGCSYFREDDQDTVYCFGPGDRTATLECATTNQAVTIPAGGVTSPAEEPGTSPAQGAGTSPTDDAGTSPTGGVTTRPAGGATVSPGALTSPSDGAETSPTDDVVTSSAVTSSAKVSATSPIDGAMTSPTNGATGTAAISPADGKNKIYLIKI